MQRLFVAFPIAGEAAREIERVQRKLEEQNSRASITWTWVKQHCTLAFLGDCDEATTALLKEKLPALAGSGAIPAQLGRLDAFPHLRQPRVLVVHINDSSHDIARLYQQVAQMAGECDVQLEGRRFTPHVTLGRIKQENARVHGLDTPVQPVAFEVSEVILFESELLPQGPRHTALLRVSL